MNHIKLYNTLSGEKQAFHPIDRENVRMYVCGPTVYNYAHIGNARVSVVFDVFARVLRILYPKVSYVSNITDVEDKIIKAAHEQKISISEITEKFAAIYNRDMKALGSPEPDIQPRATEYIDQMITLIGRLIENGNAYEAEGHVLFRVSSFPAYGRLSRRTQDEQKAGARVEVAPYKESSNDFVLWKPSSGDEPGWNSPWGYGRPGWHIECSAMAEALLGLPFDIHGGGADLKFPHHENEIAQSCCAHGHLHDISQFAKYWVHNGFVTVDSEKMSKSLGNVILVNDLLEQGVKGEAIRLTLLSAQYRQPLNWTGSLLGQSKTQLDRFYQILHELQNISDDEQDNGDFENDDFMSALCDDLNTPLAISVLNEIASAAAKERTPMAKRRFKNAMHILGIGQEDPAIWLGYGVLPEGVTKEDIEKMVKERQTAKDNKDYAQADAIRERLAALNIAIEDKPEGPVWKYSPR